MRDYKILGTAPDKKNTVSHSSSCKETQKNFNYLSWSEKLGNVDGPLTSVVNQMRPEV